jgi:hypothetical protein
MDELIEDINYILTSETYERLEIKPNGQVVFCIQKMVGK